MEILVGKDIPRFGREGQSPSYCAYRSGVGHDGRTSRGRARGREQPRPARLLMAAWGLPLEFAETGLPEDLSEVERWHFAIHESAHALIAALQNMPLDFVALDPPRCRVYLPVKLSEEAMPVELVPYWARIALAGPVIDSCLAAEPAERDMLIAAELIHSLELEPEPETEIISDAAFDDLTAEVVVMLREHQWALQELAAHLIREDIATGAEVALILAREAEARPMFRAEHRPVPPAKSTYQEWREFFS